MLIVITNYKVCWINIYIPKADGSECSFKNVGEEGGWGDEQDCGSNGWAEGGVVVQVDEGGVVVQVDEGGVVVQVDGDKSASLPNLTSLSTNSHTLKKEVNVVSGVKCKMNR